MEAYLGSEQISRNMVCLFRALLHIYASSLRVSQANFTIFTINMGPMSMQPVHSQNDINIKWPKSAQIYSEFWFP